MSANTYLPISPVEPPYLLISDITKSNPMVITVTESNNYIAGQVIHLTVPYDYGMIQADQMNVLITSVDGLDFTVQADSTQFDAFVVPSGNVVKPASLSPAGSRNIYNYSTVPFHSEDGNVGN